VRAARAAKYRSSGAGRDSPAARLGAFLLIPEAYHASPQDASVLANCELFWLESSRRPCYSAPMTTIDVLIDVLKKARTTLAEPGVWTKGWGQGTKVDGNLQTCAIGAIRDASGMYCRPTGHSGVTDGNDKVSDAIVAVVSVIEPHLAQIYPHGEVLASLLVGYNDTSLDNTCVLAAFDAAIERLEASDAAA